MASVAKISDFFEKLARDEQFEEDFDDNPRKTMREFGLSKEQQRLILGGTLREIRGVILEEGGKDVDIIMVKMR